MPYPSKGESKEEYIARFMKSSEAQSDYPEEKQRLAVAYSMWERQNFVGVLRDPPSLTSISEKFAAPMELLTKEMAIGLKMEMEEHSDDEATAGVIVLHHLDENPFYYSKGEFRNSKDQWPKMYKANHLEPGLVRYDGIGPVDPTTGKASDLVFLIKKGVIDRMRPSFKGKPVVNLVHRDVRPQDFKDGTADGIVVGARWDDSDAWDWVDFLVWDAKTQENCDKGYKVSCAYIPTEVDMTPGIYHNIPYDGEILDGEYTHLAIVSDPRYEQSNIFCNSLGGKMKEKITEKIATFFNWKGTKHAVNLDPKAEVEVDGAKVALEVLVNSYKAEQAEQEKLALKNAAETITDETIVPVDGKEISVKDLKASFKTSAERRNAADADEKKAAEDKAEAEKKAAEEKKNAEDEEKARAEKAEADKKAEDEKRNAEELAAAEKAEAEKKEKAAAEKQNSLDKEARAKFDELKNAATKRADFVEPKPLETSAEGLKRGQERYGAVSQPAPAAK